MMVMMMMMMMMMMIKMIMMKIILIDWLIDWLTIALRPAQEYLTYMETSQLPVKGCKMLAYARRSEPLSREGSLSCRTCCDTGPRFFRSHPKDRPIQSPLTSHQGMWRIYSNPDPHGSPIRRLLRHTRGCGGSILTRILTGPQSVASYDTHGVVEDLF